MSYYEIEGGRPLEGRLTIQGAKNSVLPILAAALLAPGQSVIRNCPRLTDVDAALAILRHLGCRVEREDDAVLVDASVLARTDIPESLMREMRSSVVFLGALLARLGRAELSYPGGCELGPRPIDLHLAGLRSLGMEIAEEQGSLWAKKTAQTQGREICLSMPSVGATENLMLAACGCPGVTTLVGAAREPEILDLQQFLRNMGARVSGAGGSVITIDGGAELHPGEQRVMGDRIAAATCLCAAGAAGGCLELSGVEEASLAAVLTCLEQAGCRVQTRPEQILLESTGHLRGIPPVRTAPFPGFPTDAQALLMAALAGGRGSTMFVENMFDSRYHHVDELRRMGADIHTDGRVAVVNGVGRLRGARVQGADLRGTAALVIAGLAAEGTTCVYGLRHIRRGYENLGRTLAGLGARIWELPK